MKTTGAVAFLLIAATSFVAAGPIASAAVVPVPNVDRIHRVPEKAFQPPELKADEIPTKDKKIIKFLTDPPTKRDTAVPNVDRNHRVPERAFQPPALEASDIHTKDKKVIKFLTDPPTKRDIVDRHVDPHHRTPETAFDPPTVSPNKPRYSAKNKRDSTGHGRRPMPIRT